MSCFLVGHSYTQFLEKKQNILVYIIIKISSKHIAHFEAPILKKNAIFNKKKHACVFSYIHTNHTNEGRKRSSQSTSRSEEKNAYARAPFSHTIINKKKNARSTDALYLHFSTSLSSSPSLALKKEILPSPASQENASCGLCLW